MSQPRPDLLGKKHPSPDGKNCKQIKELKEAKIREKQERKKGEKKLSKCPFRMWFTPLSHRSSKNLDSSLYIERERRKVREKSKSNKNWRKGDRKRE